jgi:hypothetical protein
LFFWALFNGDLHPILKIMHYMRMGQSMTYKLAAPSMEGCQSCGQNTANCQCLKFDKSAHRQGKTMADLSFRNPLKSFTHYAAPLFAHNFNGEPTNSTDAKADTGHSDNSSGMPTGSPTSGLSSSGPSF